MKIAENAGTPLYAAAFVNDTKFVVAGGGGQGAHGVANKAIVYDLALGKLDKVAELEFPANSDSPTSMARGSDEKSVWVGVNVPSGTAEKPSVNHLSKLEVSDKQCSLVSSYNHFKSNDIAVYQKATSVSGTFVASASSADPGLVTVFSSADEDLVSMKFDGELVGAAIADYDEKTQKYVAAASEQRIDVRTISDPATTQVSLDAPKGQKWSRIEAIGPAKFVAASTVGSRQGAHLTLVEIVSEPGAKSETKVKTRTVKIPGFKSVTALAGTISAPNPVLSSASSIASTSSVAPCPSTTSRVAVASPGGDVYIYDCTSSPRLIRKLKAVHKFPVTSLAVSPDGASVVSTSLDGSLVLHTGLSAGFRATLGWVVLSAAIIAVIALILTFFVHYKRPNIVDVYHKNALRIRRGPAVQLLSPSDHSANNDLSRESLRPATESITEDSVSAVWGTAPSPTDDAQESDAEMLDASPTPEERRDDQAKPPADFEEPAAPTHGEL